MNCHQFVAIKVRGAGQPFPLLFDLQTHDTLQAKLHQNLLIEKMKIALEVPKVKAKVNCQTPIISKIHDNKHVTQVNSISDLQHFFGSCTNRQTHRHRDRRSY